ncbi:MAG: GyrI-like domain-containing protein [Sulfuriferula sp.]|nr:GyrI-like domain-containing protein [Sulfuriferula sp.]
MSDITPIPAHSQSHSMITAPYITESVAQLTAVIHLDIARSEMQQVFPLAVNELLSVLSAQSIVPQGSAFAHHLVMTPERFNFELGFFINTHVQASGRVQAGQLPAVKVVRSVYQGDYDGLHAAWGELMAWMDANGHTPAADLWEWYQIGPHISANPADWQTELNRPIVD